jgi:hypothetical protein
MVSMVQLKINEEKRKLEVWWKLENTIRISFMQVEKSIMLHL